MLRRLLGWLGTEYLLESLPSWALRMVVGLTIAIVSPLIQPVVHSHLQKIDWKRLPQYSTRPHCRMLAYLFLFTGAFVWFARTLTSPNNIASEGWKVLFEFQYSGPLLHELLIFTVCIGTPLSMLLNIKQCEQWVESIWGERSAEEIRHEDWELRYCRNILIIMGAGVISVLISFVLISLGFFESVTHS